MTRRLAPRFALFALVSLGLAHVAGCSVSDDLVFDDAKYQAANAGGATSAGSGGSAGTATAGTTSAGTSGTGGGNAGAGGKTLVTPQCLACLNKGCSTQLDACVLNPTCESCLKQPDLSCIADMDAKAVLGCLCQQKCGMECNAVAVCQSIGMGGMGGAGGGGTGGGGAGGGGNAGSSGTGGAPTYTTCNECIAAGCQKQLIACNADPQCAPCISGMGTPDCEKNANLQAAQKCACTSDCGQLCNCDASKWCGDGKIEGGETCEGTDLGGKTCSAVIGDPAAFGSLKCDGTCHYDLSSCTSTQPFCGNKKLDPGEQCDGVQLGGKTCASVTGDPNATGQLKCTYKCGIDASSCQVMGTCGDGKVGIGEQCDLNDFGGKTCATAVGPGYSGSLKCSSMCQLDTSNCKPPSSCGNGKVDTGEDCEVGPPPNLNGKTCADALGNPGATGSLKCFANCTFDTSSCSIPTAQCGNGLKEGSEQCDKLDFGGATCGSQLGMPATGPLSCTPQCQIVTTACVPVTQFCGDGQKNQVNEACDGTDLGGQTCESVLGFGYQGSLSCTPMCSFNTSGCMLPAGICGNNIPDQATELCDGTAIRPGADCRTMMANWADTGPVSCASGCSLALGCQTGPMCNDGRLSAFEECDPSVPWGAFIPCAELFQDPSMTGQASCNGMTCKWDTAMCTTPCGGACDGNLCDGVSKCDTMTGGCGQPVPPVIDDGRENTLDFCDSGAGRVRHMFRGDTCAHSLCGGPFGTPADAMNPVGCHPSEPQSESHACIDAICKNDSFCCNNGWDNLCMQHVRDSNAATPFGVCNYSCQCTHSFCTPGDALFFRCDPCVEAICKSHPDCCDYTAPAGNGKWNQTCVNLVQSVCHIPPTGCPL